MSSDQQHMPLKEEVHELLTEEEAIDHSHNQFGHRYKFYKRRWYILILYTFFAVFQSLFAVAWGPLTKRSEKAFYLKDSDIALFNNWTNIMYLISFIPTLKLLELKGLRFTCLSLAGVMTLGTFIRCFIFWKSTWLLIIHIGQILIGIACPAATMACTHLSVVWFPPEQRVFATGVMASGQTIGQAFAYLIGPHITNVFIQRFPQNLTSGSGAGSALNVLLDSEFSKEGFFSNGTTVSVNVEVMQGALRLYIIGQCIASSLILCLLCVYFPDKPPSPPSHSAEVARYSMSMSLSHVVYSTPQLWLLTLSFGLNSGVFTGWSSVLNLAIRTTTISSSTITGILGFIMTLIGAFGMFLMGLLADKCFTKYKKPLLVLLTTATISCIIFSITVGSDVGEALTERSEQALVCVTTIIISLCLYSSVPLYFEMAADTFFPISEEAITGWLLMFQNIVTSIYLLLDFIPQIGTEWLNWSLTLAVAISIPLLFCLRATNNRTSHEGDNGEEDD